MQNNLNNDLLFNKCQIDEKKANDKITKLENIKKKLQSSQINSELRNSILEIIDETISNYNGKIKSR